MLNSHPMGDNGHEPIRLTTPHAAAPTRRTVCRMEGDLYARDPAH